MSATDSTATHGASGWFFELLVQRAAESSLVDRRAVRNAMPPLHRRYDDEAVRVLDGTVTFYVGDEVVTAAAGDVVVVPAGVARTFRVESSEARWLVLTRLRSVERYRDFGRAVSEPAGDWPSAAELSSVAAIAAANGIELLGPPGALP
jgi:mannose-6-phosphate isomerase-like protein (cupin superfamily)